MSAEAEKCHRFVTHKTYTGEGCEMCGKPESAHSTPPAPPPQRALESAYCFECDDRARCDSAETCYAHHEGYPRRNAILASPPQASDERAAFEFVLDWTAQHKDYYLDPNVTNVVKLTRLLVAWQARASLERK